MQPREEIAYLGPKASYTHQVRYSMVHESVFYSPLYA